jgi:hypothetical protein
MNTSRYVVFVWKSLGEEPLGREVNIRKDLKRVLIGLEKILSYLRFYLSLVWFLGDHKRLFTVHKAMPTAVHCLTAVQCIKLSLRVASARNSRNWSRGIYIHKIVIINKQFHYFDAVY